MKVEQAVEIERLRVARSACSWKPYIEALDHTITLCLGLGCTATGRFVAYQLTSRRRRYQHSKRLDIQTFYASLDKGIASLNAELQESGAQCVMPLVRWWVLSGTSTDAGACFRILIAIFWFSLPRGHITRSTAGRLTVDL